MAKLSRAEVEKLSRNERIEMELKLAAEHGRFPKNRMLLDKGSSAQMSSQVLISADSVLIPTHEEIRMNDLDYRMAVRDSNPVPDALKPLLHRESPKALRDSIRRNLDSLNTANRELMMTKILGQLRDLQIQSDDDQSNEDLQRIIARAVFGTGEFKDIEGEPGGAFHNKK